MFRRRIGVAEEWNEEGVLVDWKEDGVQVDWNGVLLAGSGVLVERFLCLLGEGSIELSIKVFTLELVLNENVKFKGFVLKRGIVKGATIIAVWLIFDCVTQRCTCKMRYR